MNFIPGTNRPKYRRWRTDTKIRHLQYRPGFNRDRPVAGGEHFELKMNLLRVAGGRQDARDIPESPWNPRARSMTQNRFFQHKSNLRIHSDQEFSVNGFVHSTAIAPFEREDRDAQMNIFQYKFCGMSLGTL